MKPTKPLVEVAVETEGGRVPLGIMNAKQAMSLPDHLDVKVSHPDHEAGSTDKFIRKDELHRHLGES
ncbi:hypothetical protein [Rhizobium sp. CNPSo 3490]|uniref:hypothetical protein n=1 Tax=Rhizobium sp. CNPSo 3490 TaxID=3021407 RepID=UPI00254B4BDC|nr:hypothetical protein [Rhizobium sp. CNPSo 3490]MDK4734781.1 hypothetical protein [Rhizobium sp. CNPSo 3490]